MEPKIDPSQTPPLTKRQLVVMRVYSLAGMVLLAIGIIGVWIPVLPTTIFLIGAAACFARSSPRLYAYLMNHPRFSAPLRHWFDERAISKGGKRAALVGMGIGLFILLTSIDNPWIEGVGALVILISAFFVATRPEPSDDRHTGIRPD